MYMELQHSYSSKTTQESIKSHADVDHQDSSKSLISPKRVLIKIFARNCSLLLNPWITTQLCLRCLEVSLIARRVFFGRIFIANPLSTVILLISFSLMMPEINSCSVVIEHVGILFLLVEGYYCEARYKI